MRVRSPEALWALSRMMHREGWPRLARAIKTLNWAVHKCLLPAEAEVGEGVILEHYALGVVMHPQVTLGSHCRIYHHVTLAAQSPIGSPFRIILEEGVEIGAHSIIVARPEQSLVVGAGSVLGAGAVLTRSIPAGEVWAGNPARLLHPKPVAKGADTR